MQVMPNLQETPMAEHDSTQSEMQGLHERHWNYLFSGNKMFFNASQYISYFLPMAAKVCVCNIHKKILLKFNFLFIFSQAYFAK